LLVFTPTPDITVQITMGEYIENLLTNYDYYGTRLPRIPIIPEREIKLKLMLLPEKRKRKKENIENMSLFTHNAKCKAISTQDDEFHEGYIVETYGSKCCLVRFINGDSSLFKSLEKTENKWYDQEIFIFKVKELKLLNEKSGKEPIFYSGEEVVDLGNIIIIDKFDSEIEEEEEKKKKLLLEENQIKEIIKSKSVSKSRTKSKQSSRDSSKSLSSRSSSSYHRRKKHSKRHKGKRSSRSRSNDSYRKYKNKHYKSKKRYSSSRSNDSRKSSRSSCSRGHRKKSKKRDRSRSKNRDNERKKVKNVESKQEKEEQ